MDSSSSNLDTKQCFESKLSPRQPVVHLENHSSLVGIMRSDSVFTVSQTNDHIEVRITKIFFRFVIDS